MLLAVIDGFKKGYLSTREVPISTDLLTSFRDRWDLLVDSKHVSNFSLPFFHLGNEPSGIWELNPFAGKTILVTKSNSIKSFKALQETVSYAGLSNELFQALGEPARRDELERVLLERYFPDTAPRMQVAYPVWSEKVKEEILYEPGINYARKIIRRMEEMTLPEREEEIILRGHIFKNAILTDELNKFSFLMNC
jgi:putative restriction endonuclease